MSIRFSGTAAQVESTFHTEIHNLQVKGVQHIGNMSDPRIPAALAPVVVGVKSLHNFFPRPLHRTGSKVSRDASTGKWQRVSNVPSDSTAKSHSGVPRPQFGVSVPASGGSSAYLVEDVVPYDFATIYNLLPLWNASTPIDGAGQTIAIAGTSDIAVSDVTTFRSTFGLPAYTSANQPTIISGNSQPLTVCTDSTQYCTQSDLIENSLDMEWAGSTAPGANIVLVASYPASASDDGLYDSESYIVSNQTARIINVSYGLCELGNGTAGNVQYYNLWQTASTEGIAVFVASGDAGAADCDDGGDSVGNPYSAQYGLSVNGLASTPYNTAVGGTDFNWCNPGSTTECTAAPYWNTTNAANGSSAVGYVPEVPWNDTCANPLAVSLFESWATSSAAGNVGGVTDPESACNFIYNKWQLILNNTGGTADGADLSYYIDTVGAGGGASGCVVGDGSNTSSCVSSTTTTGSANGSITLVKDGWPKPSWQTGVAGIPSDGVRDLPDMAFFASDGFLSSSSYLICVSAIADCTYGTSAEPIAQEVGGTSVSTPAMAGVMALINQKAGEAQGNPNTELYRLASQQTYANCSSSSSSTSNSCYFNDIDTDTNATPCNNGATEGNPSQTGIKSPNCTAATNSDLVGILSGNTAGVGYDQATGLGSLNVANVVNAWPASTATEAATVTVTPAQTTLGASSTLSVAVTVAASTSGVALRRGVAAVDRATADPW
jgi:subtilase family serine protease